MKIKLDNKKTYFIVSDVHNHFTLMLNALKENGFEETNSNHIVISAGDFFDRQESEAPLLLEWIKSMLNQNRLIWIRGNHEDLLLSLLNNRLPYQNDYFNGTVSTCCQLAGVQEEDVDFDRVVIKLISEDSDLSNSALNNKANKIVCDNWMKVSNKLDSIGIREFIQNNTVNYVEIDKYVIVHSFIPLRNGKYNPAWREDADFEEWKKSRWECPFEKIKKGLFKEESSLGRILIFGHWSNAYGRAIMNNENFDWYDPKNDHSIFIDKDFIALDATTVLSKKVNVFVIKGK